MKTYELVINATWKGVTDIDVKVEFDGDGNIIEMLLYSFEFNHWFSILSEARRERPAKFQDIQDRVIAEINDPDFKAAVKHGA